VLPGELPGVLGVMATGPVGYPGYTMNIASYSSVGGDLAAPGGDYFSASGTVQDAVIGATPANSSIFAELDPLNAFFPGLTAADVAALVALAGADAPTVVLAPDRHERGTNALLLRPPDAIPFAFGPDSLARHQAVATARGLPVRLYYAPGTALDLDTPEDLAALPERAAGLHP
jgi:hypothetical protein